MDVRRIKRRGALLWGLYAIALGVFAGSTVVVMSYRSAWPVLIIAPAVLGLIGARVGYVAGYRGGRAWGAAVIAVVAAALGLVAPFAVQRYRFHQVRQHYVPVYPGARETAFDVALVPETSFPGFTATYETDATPERLLAFFRYRLTEEGWQEISPVRLFGSNLYRFDRPGFRLQLQFSQGGAYAVNCMAFNLLYRPGIA